MKTPFFKKTPFKKPFLKNLGNSITESTERMNLGTSGNLAIGMGSTTGDAQLQVSGTVNVGGTSNFGNRVNLRGNTYIYDSAEWCNVAPSSWFHIHSPDTTIDSENVIITGNLVVQGTRTYNDTTVTVTEDKTFVIQAVFNPDSLSPTAARKPAPPAPTTKTSYS